MATAEDVVLTKLEWATGGPDPLDRANFRLSGEPPNARQMEDVAGVLKRSADLIDDAYLNRWAPDLDIVDVLAAARAKARS